MWCKPTITNSNTASVVLLLIAAFGAFDAPVEAAPVTLRFEAQVGPPRQGVDGMVPPEWNISLQEGEVVSGTFTFEPFDAASNVVNTTLVQPLDFSIDIKGRTLSTSQYSIEVFDDATSDEAPEPTDSISVGCSFFGGGTVCTPPTVSTSEPIEWAFSLGVIGESEILDGADIPSDSSVWQQFQYHGMIVTLIDSSTRISYGFSATPQSFRAVPEPLTGFYVVTGALIILFAARSPKC